MKYVMKVFEIFFKEDKHQTIKFSGANNYYHLHFYSALFNRLHIMAKGFRSNYNKSAY